MTLYTLYEATMSAISTLNTQDKLHLQGTYLLNIEHESLTQHPNSRP